MSPQLGESPGGELHRAERRVAPFCDQPAEEPNSGRLESPPGDRRSAEIAVY
jgi:hypothetical protein